ncbi:hypothetical protein NTGBS_100025 [Candidatus Nitrotoga sp. BS]|nr:hypothetical protein NTGBS_100025 [Candidatus Nitrotoga sp. BS]
MSGHVLLVEPLAQLKGRASPNSKLTDYQGNTAAKFSQACEVSHAIQIIKFNIQQLF